MKENWGDYYERKPDSEIMQRREGDANNPDPYTGPIRKGPTEKRKAYDSIFTSWIRMETTPYQFGKADLKAVHWVMSVLTRRSVAIKCECDS